MARKKRLSQKYKIYDKKYIDYKNLLLIKLKKDYFYCIILFRQEGQIYESTYFLSYNHFVANYSIDSEFNYEL